MTVNGVERAVASLAYADAVERAGGTPIVLPPEPKLAVDQLALCDGLVLTGGDDPVLEPFGVTTDPRVTPVHERRQCHESTIIDHLRRHDPDRPVLGVCLGMQMMTLHAGGTLEQYMPDACPTHAQHWDQDHPVSCTGSLQDAEGIVHSRHKQAVADPGSLVVCASAPDGVIEAVEDRSRRMYLGVQWHPERTESEPLGIALFRRLVRSSSSE